MFEFLKSAPKDLAHPLTTPKTAAAWFHHLPARDVLARQQEVIRTLATMAHSAASYDAPQIAAIEWLDSALAPDRVLLLRNYAETAVSTPPAAARIWHVAY